MATVLPGIALAVPFEFTHSARILDANGGAVNGSTDFVISLYDGAGSGTAVWFEPITHDVQDGYVSLRLGANPTYPLDTSQVVDGDPLWLGIQIGTEPELPIRTEIGSSLYAMRADVATDVDGGDVVAATVSATELQVGDPGATCGASEAGVVRYAGGVFQGCDGAGNWIDLGQQDTDTMPTPGAGIAVSGAEVSLDTVATNTTRRLAKYTAICTARAQHSSSYATVSAVTPADTSITLPGEEEC